VKKLISFVVGQVAFYARVKQDELIPEVSLSGEGSVL